MMTEIGNNNSSKSTVAFPMVYVVEDISNDAGGPAGNNSGYGGTDVTSKIVDQQSSSRITPTSINNPCFQQSADVLSSANQNSLDNTNNSNNAPAAPTNCAICGNPATGTTFGFESCNPCKKFFQRHRFDRITDIRCELGGRYTCDLSKRRPCTKCRLLRCLRLSKQTPPSFLRDADRNTRRISKHRNVMTKLRSFISERKPGDPSMSTNNNGNADEAEGSSPIVNLSELSSSSSSTSDNSSADNRRNRRNKQPQQRDSWGSSNNVDGERNSEIPVGAEVQTMPIDFSKSENNNNAQHCRQTVVINSFPDNNSEIVVDDDDDSADSDDNFFYENGTCQKRYRSAFSAPFPTSTGAGHNGHISTPKTSSEKPQISTSSSSLPNKQVGAMISLPQTITTATNSSNYSIAMTQSSAAFMTNNNNNNNNNNNTAGQSSSPSTTAYSPSMTPPVPVPMSLLSLLQQHQQQQQFQQHRLILQSSPPPSTSDNTPVVTTSSVAPGDLPPFCLLNNNTTVSTTVTSTSNNTTNRSNFSSASYLNYDNNNNNNVHPPKLLLNSTASLRDFVAQSADSISSSYSSFCKAFSDLVVNFAESERLNLLQNGFHLKPFSSPSLCDLAAAFQLYFAILLTPQSTVSRESVLSTQRDNSTFAELAFLPSLQLCQTDSESQPALRRDLFQLSNIVSQKFSNPFFWVGNSTADTTTSTKSGDRIYDEHLSNSSDYHDDD